jgi:transcriptional regulator GlxA family with amidase domain
MEDVRFLRIERARELIMTTNAPLKTIAEATGIANVYHLSHLFRQRLGTPPGALRSRTRKPPSALASKIKKGIRTPPGDVP